LKQLQLHLELRPINADTNRPEQLTRLTILLLHTKGQHPSITEMYPNGPHQTPIGLYDYYQHETIVYDRVRDIIFAQTFSAQNTNMTALVTIIFLRLISFFYFREDILLTIIH